MKSLIITTVLFIFVFSLFSQEDVGLTETEKKKLTEEVACFTECADFILYVDACVLLMELSFKSENLDFRIHDYNTLYPFRFHQTKPELLYASCNWQSREITLVDLTHSKVTGVFDYFITNDFGQTYFEKNSIKCELVRTPNGWKINNMEELIVLNDHQSANLY